MRGNNKKENKEILKNIRKKEGAKKRFLLFGGGCFLAALLVIFILFGLIAFVVAKTGIVNIPVFSSLFYKEPTPVREVVPSKNIISSLEELISINNNDILISFTEEDLTALIAKGLEDDSELPFSDMQAAITPSGIEFFGRITEPISTHITTIIKPKITAGELGFDLIELKLGNVMLPSSIVESLVTELLDSQFDEINESFSKSLELKEIILIDGKMEIKGKLLLPE